MILILKNREIEGFYLEPAHSHSPKHAKYFTDSRNKVLLDNTAPYGHFITSWLHSLLTTLEDPALSPSNTTILIYLSSDNPDLALEHMSTVTAFISDKLRRRGYQVEYIESEAFYVSNLYGPLTPPFTPDILLPQTVGRFLEEGITKSSYGPQEQPEQPKLYISRQKTTTSNSKQLARIDDESLLEKYFTLLGFTSITPEDFTSYQDQLNTIASAKAIAGITSSALYSALVLPSTSKLIEICTMPLHTSDRFPDHYRSIALIQGNQYVPIPNVTRRAQDVIDYIEANPELKALLAS